MSKEPTSLQEAILYFANPDNCIDYVAIRRWPNGVICPGCGSAKASFNAKRRTWKCGSHHPKREFSIKVGTIYEDSPIPLDKWLTATWMLTNCKNGVSSYEIARDINVSQKSAWFMLQRIRLAMQDEFFGSKLGTNGGEVEVDETYIGGKARNMHLSVKQRRITGRVQDDKTTVMGFMERGGKVRTEIVRDRQKGSVQPMVRKHVQAGSALYSDEMGGYKGLQGEYQHHVIDHAVQYVDGRVHTNTLENFWSLLKRGISGTYVSVEPFHLFRYLDEQAFRYNNRKDKTDSERFTDAMSRVAGKRLTFAQVSGKLHDPTHYN